MIDICIPGEPGNEANILIESFSIVGFCGVPSVKTLVLFPLQYEKFGEWGWYTRHICTNLAMKISGQLQYPDVIPSQQHA